MYSKGKPGSIPSDAQAREKLALYVYEYLLHMGCQQAAQSFLTEINWDKNITLGEPPGFLHSWWCVFWDLYCAAPERRETYEHSNEAKAFHDYGFVNSGGFPNGHHPAAPSPLNMPAGEGPGMPCQPGAPGPSGMAFFPGPPGGQQPGPMPSGPVDIRPGMVHPGMRMGGVPPGPPRLPMNHNFGQGGPPPGHVVGPRGPPGPPPGPGTPIGVPPHPVGPGSRPTWLPPHSQYSSASPVAFNGPPPPGPGTPGIMPSPQESCVSDPYGPPPGMRVPPNHPAAAAAAAAAVAAFGPQSGPGMPHSNPSSVGAPPDGVGPVVTSAGPSGVMMPHDMAPLPPHMMNGGPPGPPQSAHSMPPNDPHMGMDSMKSSPAAHGGSVGVPPRSDDMSSGIPMSVAGPPMPGGMDPNVPPGMYIRPSMPPHSYGDPISGNVPPHPGAHGPPPHGLPPGHPMMNGPPQQLSVQQSGMPPHPATAGLQPGDSSENAAILKIKESMQEEAKRFEKMEHVGQNVPPSHLPPHSVSEAGPPGPPVHGGPPPPDPYFIQQ